MSASLSELFARDPFKTTREDVMSIIVEMRRLATLHSIKSSAPKAPKKTAKQEEIAKAVGNVSLDL